MDAVKFLKEEKRMLLDADEDCEYLNWKKSGQFGTCISLVEQWSKAYPLKTYKSEFLKLFPSCGIDRNGYPMTNIYYLIKYKGNDDCTLKDTYKAWDSEFKGWS